jgi:hypothetical protein
LAESTTPPYSYSWVNPPAGVYNVSARAIYQQSSAASSGTNLLAVLANPASPVTVTGISPTSINYTGGAGSQFVLLQSASVTNALANWSRVATNVATPGSFSISATNPAAFYSIKSE